MLNLNIGDVVYHAGTKRTIEAVKSVAGRTFFKLSGHAYMVRLEHVKPVIRLTDVVRARALIDFVSQVKIGFGASWPEDWTFYFISNKGSVRRRDYDDACDLLGVHDA